MIFEQFYLACLSHASYLIADESTKTAVVVDPQRDIDQYLQKADELGVEIRHVILTHFHADFLAGHLELRERTGAEIHLGSVAKADFDFNAMADGDAIEVGQLKIECMETPGHTPEGISMVVYDLANDADNPHSVLTGDTLFVGDVGRPDLMASIGITAEELGAMLFDSLHDKLMKLPDETLVYPAHGAGSMCGKSLGTETFSTIGEQRKTNPSLQPMSKEEFITLVSADQPVAPKYFPYDAILNRKERATLEDTMQKAMSPLDLDEVLRLRDQENAQVLDLRDADHFAEGHISSSINVGLGGKFATWAGAVIDPERPVVLVGNVGDEQEAIVRLGRVGLDCVVGFLKGGAAAITDEHRSAQPRIDATVLRDWISAGQPMVVVDVRQPGEHAAGHIDTSRNLPLSAIEQRMKELPKEQRIVVTCQSGYRSSVAASVLRANGFGDVVDQRGGWKAWDSMQASQAH